MKNAYLVLQVFSGAFKGGLISLVVAFIVLTVIGILFGYGGPLLALYFAGLLILYVAPAGLLLGAIVTGIRLFGKTDDLSNSRKNKKTWTIAWVGVPLILIACILIAPYLLTNVTRNVRHGASWTTELRSDCDTPAVILMLKDYAKYEVVCSPKLLNYLQTHNQAIVPITYQVTYDFGEPRSYQLTDVDDIEVSWSEWLEGPSGCGGEYTPACDSPQVRNGSPLYESSWLDK